MESLVGMDAAFLSLETPTTPMHVGVALVLDPPEGTRSLFSPSTRYAQIRRVIQQRLHLIAPLRQRALRVPVRSAPPGVGRRPGFRSGRPPRPGQPALARRPGRARRLRGRDHEPPVRSGPPALGDARGRGPGGGAHGTGGQGAPRHPRRGERGVGPGGLLGPDAADPHRGAAPRMGPRTLALQHADAAPRRVVVGAPAGIGPQHAAGRGGGGGGSGDAQPRAGRSGGAIATRASSPRPARRSTARSRTASALPASPSRSRT